MAKMQRITDLCEPPVVGRMYLVPVVTWRWYNLEKQWPVFLPIHTDAEWLKFPDRHYHIDPRFLNERQCRQIGNKIMSGDELEMVQRAPISSLRFSSIDPPPHQWARRKCYRADVPYRHGHREPIKALQDGYAGQTARHVRTGWTCPHKGFPLGSIDPDADGIITCPLHGLRIRASDGQCLPATRRAAKGVVEMEL
jgi:nitrite reductase/ring-hydroxylating ferredoxin subunit